MNERLMRLALRLARKGCGTVAPNPMVGAVLVRGTRLLGQGFHRQAGEPHAEIEALRDATRNGYTAKGATLYVTLEPCCTHGRTPPCTEAIIAAGIKHVVVGASDPNPSHAGRGLKLLADAGLKVETAQGKLARECAELNAAFNHWMVNRTPYVTIKAAMTLDGKIATESGQSKWITSELSRRFAMRLRFEADAILAGVSTIVADDPSLTLRLSRRVKPRPLLRLVLDPAARVPLAARVLTDASASLTTVVVGPAAPAASVKALARKVSVWRCPRNQQKGARSLDLRWLLQELGKRAVTSLLVEGGGETAAGFLSQGLAHQVAFFYAPKILGGGRARRAVAGDGAEKREDFIRLERVRWRQMGPDLLLLAKIVP